MKIKFLGAAGTVTGSSYLVTSSFGRSIMVDCGMFQGLQKIEVLNHMPIGIGDTILDGIVLTHAHLDHCGRLPLVNIIHPNAPIYGNAPSLDLAQIALTDAAKIAAHCRNGLLYTDLDVERTFSQMREIQNYTPYLLGDFRITHYDAGHILGSTSLLLEELDNMGNTIHRVVFSGDIGNFPELIVKETDKLDLECNTVIIETTYGDRLHPFGDIKNILLQNVERILKTKGTLLIPAFALERTQELLILFAQLKSSGKIPQDLPIYLDSPMGIAATDTYTKYSSYFNSTLQNLLTQQNVFNFSGLEIIGHNSQSMSLHKNTHPQVIIAGSGMMTGGRVVSHSKNLLPQAKNQLLIVGYQGEGTLGREILDGKKQVWIMGEKVDINAGVDSTQILSSHADQSQLLKWLAHLKKFSSIVLTHGENSSREVFGNIINDVYSMTKVYQPLLQEEIKF